MRAGARIVPQDAEPGGGGRMGEGGEVGNNSKLNETHGKAQMYKKRGQKLKKMREE